MKKLSRDEVKKVMGGYENPNGSWTCSGSGFGSETYAVATQAEAQQLVIQSIILGSCENLGDITCRQNMNA